MSSKDTAANLPWVEKYRPKTLDDLIAHEDIISTINKLIDAKRLPHLLFYGPPGTGKTSTILACARTMYGSSLSAMVLELNASDDRGIGVVRDQIKEFAGSRLIFNKGVKLVILDEADSMSSDAQFALRRVIEKFSSNTRFCLICNYVSKIIPALQSRCTRFRFAPLATHQIQGRLKYIIEKEGLRVEEDGLRAIMRVGNGDMRKALNILQAASMSTDVIDEKSVYDCTGDPQPADMKELVKTLLDKSYPECYAALSSMMVEKGYALADMVKELSKFIMAINFPPMVRAQLFKDMSDAEFRLTYSTTDSIQAGGVVSAWWQAREMLQGSKPEMGDVDMEQRGW